MQKIDRGRVSITKHLVIERIDVCVIGYDLMILADAVNVEKVFHQSKIGFIPFDNHKNLAFSLSIEFTAHIQLFKIVAFTQLSGCGICQSCQPVFGQNKIAVGPHDLIGQ